MRHALSGGRRQGCITGMMHGLGVGLYALLSISGLAVLITTSPQLFKSFEWAGAAYLTWLGIKGLRAKPVASGSLQTTTTGRSAALDGFLIVFLNPKIAVFFIALFSQVIGPATHWFERGLYAGTAWLIDTGWYVLVAVMVTQPKWLNALQKHAVWFDRAFGIILLALAAKLVAETLA